jgi:hypothetical protein
VLVEVGVIPASFFFSRVDANLLSVVLWAGTLKMPVISVVSRSGYCSLDGDFKVSAECVLFPLNLVSCLGGGHPNPCCFL